MVLSMVRMLSQFLDYSLPCGATLCCNGKSFPDFKQKAHWDCTGQFRLKNQELVKQVYF